MRTSNRYGRFSQRPSGSRSAGSMPSRPSISTKRMHRKSRFSTPAFRRASTLAASTTLTTRLPRRHASLPPLPPETSRHRTAHQAASRRDSTPTHPLLLPQPPAAPAILTTGTSCTPISRTQPAHPHLPPRHPRASSPMRPDFPTL